MKPDNPGINIKEIECVDDLPQKMIMQDEYIKLWQYFESRADTLKDKLWTFAMFLLSLAGVLVGYIINQKVIIYTSQGFRFDAPHAALVFALLGMLLCVFGCLVMDDYGKHIQRNWERSDTLVEKIIPLKEILNGKKSSKSKIKLGIFRKIGALTLISRQCMALFLIYIVVFFLIAIGAILNL